MSWEMVVLEDVCKVIAGQSPPSQSYNKKGEGLPFFQGKADFGFIYPEVRAWSTEPKKIAKPNDILISVRAPVGPTNICNIEAAIGRGLSAIRTGKKIENFYLLYFLRSNEHILASKGTGSTFTAITQKEIKNIQIPLPPLETQKKIVNILDKAQELIDKRKQQIDLMDSLVQSLFYDMFGDPVTNPKNFNFEELGNCLYFITSGSRGWAKYYSNSGGLFVRIQNLKNKKLDLSNVQYVNVPKTQEAERTKLQANDLILSITADLGRTAVVDEETAKTGAYINQHLSIIRLKEKILPVFAAHFLESDGGKKQIDKFNQVGVKSGLNFNSIKKINMIIPPITLQNKFAEKVEKIEIQKQKMQKSLKDLEQNFNSLMQKAFKGEI